MLIASCFSISWGVATAAALFLACRCSLQHHRITHFLLISPDFRGGGRKGEDISCLVVKSGKCYQRKGNGEVMSLGFLL